ncbi:MAG: YcgN family cysteine cluster protein [Methylobacter tundripaludum]|nr:YcgN family cysteine cluster protein [Methylobacter tundripaludum]
MSFWKTKKLSEMTTEEWESLCDNCGKCCLHKLEDEDTGDIYFTSVVCNLIDLDTCRCTRYAERTQLVPECLDLKQHDFAEYNWLPATCAYRLLSDGEELPDWHPLLSKSADSVQDAGVSISSYAMKESEIDDMEDHIIEWLE